MDVDKPYHTFVWTLRWVFNEGDKAAMRAEPLKEPRIDFAETAKRESHRRRFKRSRLSAKQVAYIAPAAIDERPEDEGVAEAAVVHATPKRSLWRKW